MRLKGSFVFLILMIVLCLYLLVEALSFPFRSKVFPIFLGILPILVFSGIQMLTECRKGKEMNNQEEEEEEEEGPIAWKKTILVFAWVVGFIVMVAVVGFVVAIPIFSFLFLKLFWKERWHVALLTSMIIIAIVYGVFVMAFKIPLYKGIL